jgi:integrase
MALRPVDPGVALPPLKSVRLLDQLRERIRLLHYSLRAEEACVYWSRAYIRFHRLRHPAEMGKAELECFLTHLAAEKGLSASTHRQALSALIFLYGKVLGLQLPWLAEIGRPVPVRRLPVVLSRDEVAAVLGGLQGVHRCWRGCCTARVCASAKACNFGSRKSTLPTARWWCARARAARIAS